MTHYVQRLSLLFRAIFITVLSLIFVTSYCLTVYGQLKGDKILKMTLTSKTNTPLQITMRKGTAFVPDTPDKQILRLDNIRGDARYVAKIEDCSWIINVPPGTSTTITLHTLCVNRNYPIGNSYHITQYGIQGYTTMGIPVSENCGRVSQSFEHLKFRYAQQILKGNYITTGESSKIGNKGYREAIIQALRGLS